MIGRVSVALHPDARRTINAAANGAAPSETGGLLLGWWEDRHVVVRAAVEVADPSASSNSWTRRKENAQRALDHAIATFDHPWIGYVGDWHSHPSTCDASHQDLASIRQASLSYPNPLILLVHRPDGQLDVRAAARGRLRRATVHVPPA
jgi:integrative and conjugative element protein (TIGR02256 family)